MQVMLMKCLHNLYLEDNMVVLNDLTKYNFLLTEYKNVTLCSVIFLTCEINVVILLNNKLTCFQLFY